MKRTPHGLVLTAALAWILSPSLSHAELRVFTSNDGKTLMAELVDATATSATLKLENGEKSRVALNRLSAADQSYVTSWISAHPAAIRYGFTVDWAKEHIGGTKEVDTRFKRKINDRTETQQLIHFKITNRAAVSLENVTVHVKIYEKTINDKDHYIKIEHTIPKMAAGETVTVDSDPITMQQNQFKGGSYTSGGVMYVYVPDGPTHAADSIRGYTATILHGGREVYSTSSSGYKGLPATYKQP